MGFMRIYSGDDGESHIEEMDLESHPNLTELHSVTGIVFRQSEPGHFSDWHHAPRRQYVITIQGEGEIGLGDRISVWPRTRHTSRGHVRQRPHDPSCGERASYHRIGAVRGLNEDRQRAFRLEFPITRSTKI